MLICISIELIKFQLSAQENRNDDIFTRNFVLIKYFNKELFDNIWVVTCKLVY
jgi:hypothetical protein